MFGVVHHPEVWVCQDFCCRFSHHPPFSPNRFTCEGFLLLLKGRMLGPDDFEFVSGLVFLAA